MAYSMQGAMAYSRRGRTRRNSGSSGSSTCGGVVENIAAIPFATAPTSPTRLCKTKFAAAPAADIAPRNLVSGVKGAAVAVVAALDIPAPFDAENAASPAVADTPERFALLLMPAVNADADAVDAAATSEAASDSASPATAPIALAATMLGDSEPPVEKLSADAVD